MTETSSRRDLLAVGLATAVAAATPASVSAQSRGRFRVALTGDYEDLALRAAPWASLGPDFEVVAFNKPLVTQGETIRALKDFDAVVLIRERTPLTRAMIAALPRLKLVVFSGPSNAALDHAAAAERGIFVAHALAKFEPGTQNEGGPTELAIALMLACAWHIPQADALVRRGGWAMQPAIPLKIPLSGRVLGIPGYGGIGAQVGKLGQALGMRVLGFSRSLTDEQARANNVTKADLEGVMRQSDVVSVHLPLTRQTRGMIGAKEIAMMKPGAIFINTARAPIVDEAALIAGLRTRRIAMAGFDVYNVEPLPRDHPFKTLPNVVMTPHVGYAAEGGLVAHYKSLREVIAAYREGKAQRHVPVPADLAV